MMKVGKYPSVIFKGPSKFVAELLTDKSMYFQFCTFAEQMLCYRGLHQWEKTQVKKFIHLKQSLLFEARGIELN